MRARVYERPRGKWFLDFSDHAGRRVRRWAPEARSKIEAKRALQAALNDVAAIRRGEKDVLDNSALVADLTEGFLLHKLATRRYATVAFYRVALGDMLGRFTTPQGKVWPPERETPFDAVKRQARTFKLGALGVARVDELTPERVEQYIEARRGDLAVRTLNKTIVAVKTMLAWAVKAGRIKSNPVAGLSRAGKPAKSGRALDAEEVEKLLDASPEPYRTLWLAFATTGLRRGELVKLKWPQVDFATGTIRVLPETSKSKGQRDVPIVPALRRRLRALAAEAPDPEGHVFVNRDGRPWVNNLPRRFARCIERAGIDGKGVSIHTLRHSFATHLLMNGANAKVVSDLLGHSSTVVTLDVYAHALPRNKEEAVAMLPFPRVTAEQDVSLKIPRKVPINPIGASACPIQA